MLGFFRAVLGPEIEDPDEETFLLFAHKRPEAQNLGFVDPHAAILDLSVAGRDLVVHQSPAVLTSNRAGGTTGAVLWKITPAVAAWLARPDNFLFAGVPVLSSPLSPPQLPPLGLQSTLLELGCGISGVIGMTLTGMGSSSAPAAAPGAGKPGKTGKTGGRSTRKKSSSAKQDTAARNNTVARYVLTDQPYVAKLVLQNLEANRIDSARGTVHFTPLDWETDIVSSDLLSETDTSQTRHGSSRPTSFDAVLACDCIYNEALIAPLVQTCADVCRLRADTSPPLPPTICIIAQQLREPDVLTAWLTAFHEVFQTWRVSEDLLTKELQPSAGFAVHVGILR